MDLTELQRRELDADALARPRGSSSATRPSRELPLVPRRFEVSFGSERSAPELQRGLDLGDGLTLSGKIDRIDRRPVRRARDRAGLQVGQDRALGGARSRASSGCRSRSTCSSCATSSGSSRSAASTARSPATARRAACAREAATTACPGFAKNDYLDEDAFWGQVDRRAGARAGVVERIRAGDVHHDPKGGAVPDLVRPLADVPGEAGVSA